MIQMTSIGFQFFSVGKRLLTIGMLIALISFLNEAIAQVPFVPGDAAKEAVKKTATAEERALNPAALSADWWRNIDAMPAERQQRVNQAIADLRKYFAALPAERKAESEAEFDRAVANLKLYAEMMLTKPPVPVPSHSFAESYTLEQWLELSRKLITVEEEIDSDQEYIKRMEKRITTMRQRFDTLTAAYFEHPDGDAGKALAGLQLIGYWAGMVTLEARQKTNKQALSQLNETAGYLAEELKVADGRIQANKKSLKRLKKQIEQAEQALDQAHEDLVRIEGKGFVSGIDSAVAKAGNRLHEQKLVNASVNEALEMLTLIRLRNLHDIALLLNKANDENHFAQLRDEQRQRQRDVDAITNSVTLWRETSSREQGLAGEALAALVSSTEVGDTKLKKVHSERLELAQQALLLLQRIDDELRDVEVTSKRLNHELVRARGILWDWYERSRTTLVAIFETGSGWLSESLFKIGDAPVTAFGLLRVVFIITIAWWLSALIRRGLSRIRDSGTVANTAFLYTFGRLLHYVLITLGIIIGLSSIGVDFTSLALIAGALGVGMGFGLQTIVSNFVSGLIVLFESSLRVGDFVELDSGVTGEVKEINVRSTLITTNDNVDVLVPNSEFIGGKVINWTLTDAIRRVHVPFGVAYGSDKELVRKAVLEAAENVPWSLKHPRKDRAPQVWLTGFGDSSLDFELVVWIVPEGVKRPNGVQAAYLWEIETALSKYQIEIPFPQRDLHLRSGFEHIV